MSTAVYWLLGAEDQILYVGCTNSLRLGQRIAEHAGSKAWWPTVASVAHTDSMPRDEALRVEREDIETLRPVHNVAHRRQFDPDAPQSDDLTDLIGSAVAARLLGINRATFNRWAARDDAALVVKIPGRTGVRLFHRADIEALAKIRSAA